MENDLSGTPSLTVHDLTVDYRVSRTGRSGRHLRAVRGLNLEIERGETVAIVGESGSGKSSAARGITRLVPGVGGTVLLDGQELTALSGRALRRARRGVQMVFQDPYSSLDPSATVGNIVAEPLRVHERISRGERNARVVELLGLVGLGRDHLDRYPHEFSGGQRQRIAIARAIALNPSVLILDEAVSALDVSTQNQILSLLRDLQIRLGLSYLFISHDLAVVRWIADRTIVMYLGTAVEVGPTDRVHDRPAHPYTQSLVSAMPVPSPTEQRTRERIVLEGDMPDPLDPPSGCPFRTRCRRAETICAEEVPRPQQVDHGGWSACHFADEMASQDWFHIPIERTQ